MASVTSGISLRYQVEATFGTAPPTSGYQDVRFTAESLKPNMTYIRSNSIRADGQTTNLLRTDAQGGGTISVELAWEEYDTWMEAVLLSQAWGTSATAISAGAASQFTASTSAPGVPFLLTVTGETFVTKNYKVGMWVKVSGFTGGNVAANGIYKVIEVAETILHLQGNPAAIATSGESVVAIEQVEEIANGLTERSFAVEREDEVAAAPPTLTDEFALYVALGFQRMTLRIPAADIVTAEFEVIGKKPSLEATTIGTTAVTKTADPMVSSNVDLFLEGDTQLTNTSASLHLWNIAPFKLLEFTMQATPSLRVRNAVGNVGPALQHGRGDMLVTGTIRLYYHAGSDNRDDKVLLNKVLQGTVSSLAIRSLDTVNPLPNYFLFDLPRVKFIDGQRVTPARSQDVVLELTYEAYRSLNDYNDNTNVEGTTIRIIRGTSPTALPGD